MKNEFKWLFYVVFFLLGVILVLLIIWPCEPPVIAVDTKLIDSLSRELEIEKTRRAETEKLIDELTIKLELTSKDLTETSLRYEKIMDSLAGFTYNQHVEYFLRRTTRSDPH